MTGRLQIGDTEFRCETHISAKRSRAQKTAWFPDTQSDQGWPQSPRKAAGQGPQKPLGLARVSRALPCRTASTTTPLGRLKNRVEFLRLREGPSWRSDSLVLQAQRRPDAPGHDGLARFGFTATRRLGNAATRNRARRRLKETVRLVAGRYARPGYDYVVIARQGALTRSFEDMQKDLRACFEGVHKKQPGRS